MFSFCSLVFYSFDFKKRSINNDSPSHYYYHAFLYLHHLTNIQSLVELQQMNNWDQFFEQKTTFWLKISGLLHFYLFICFFFNSKINISKVLIQNAI